MPAIQFSVHLRTCTSLIYTDWNANVEEKLFLLYGTFFSATGVWLVFLPKNFADLNTSQDASTGTRLFGLAVSIWAVSVWGHFDQTI